MKNLLPVLLVLFSLSDSHTQSVWNKKLPISIYFGTIPVANARMDNGKYLVTASKIALEISREGTITGHSALTPNVPAGLFSNYIRKRKQQGGTSFFVVGNKSAQLNKPYILSIFRPGQGFTDAVALADSWGYAKSRCGAFVETDDSTLVVFGKTKCWKLTVQESGIVTTDWEQSLNFSPVADNLAGSAVFHDDHFIVASLYGDLVTLDANGNQTGMQSHLFRFRSIQAGSDGLIACGSTPDSIAFLAKFDFNGNLLWSKTYSDKEYNDVIFSSTGGYVVTGVSDSSAISLARMDNDGNLIWRRQYQKGYGASVLEDPDGGFLLTATAFQPNALYAIKTDASGFTAPLESTTFVRERQIKTAHMQLTQFPVSSIFFNIDNPAFIYTDYNATGLGAFSPQIGGYAPDNTLHIAADEFSPYSGADFRPGITEVYTPDDFNRTWYISREQVEQLRLDFETDYALNAPVPFDILTWPGKGNPNWVQNLDFTTVETPASLFPAPFFDYNGDDIYNVYDGDYPLMKGDQMIWRCMTDDTQHSTTLGNKLNLDLCFSVYAYDCPQNAAIDYSLFADYEFINRSGTDYHDTYVGFFTDFDLGCPFDDNIGTLPESNTIFVYNADEIDQDCVSELSAFGTEIPVQTITYLNQSLDHSIYYNNASVGAHPPSTTNPEYDGEFYKVLTGKWRDGDLLTTGGDGYNPGSADFSNYIFPDNPANPQGWSMCTVNLSNADRRMVSSHGPFDFAAGDRFLIQVAFTLHQNIPHPCPDISGQVKPVIDQIRQWKNDGILDAAPDLVKVVNLPPGQTAVLDAGADGIAYLWSTGAQTPAITVTLPGKYDVTITLETGCEVRREVLVQLGASSQAPGTDMAWSLRPNPASGYFWVEHPANTGDHTRILLRNTLGVPVFEKQVSGNTTLVECPDIPPGLYWVEVFRDNISIGGKKIILNRNP
jgi:hypothetical protein